MKGKVKKIKEAIEDFYCVNSLSATARVLGVSDYHAKAILRALGIKERKRHDMNEPYVEENTQDNIEWTDEFIEKDIKTALYK